MMHLILGPSGSGKTFAMKEQVKRFSELNPDAKILFLVPEQFSFETERAFYYGLGAEASLRVQVLSFTRLANFIFRENGGLAGTYLNASGKAVLMNTALHEVQDTLLLYSRQAQVPVFTAAMLGTVAELKYAGISCAGVDKLSKKMGKCILKDKLHDVSLIYQAYEALLSKGWLNDEDDLDRALALVRENGFFKDYTVFADGFKGFTFQELQMLEAIITQTGDCWFAFCTDRIACREDCSDLYAPVTKMVSRLISSAQKNHVPVASPIYLDKPRRFRQREIAHLQKNLFCSDGEPYQETAPHIRLFAAENRYREITLAASQIRKLVREQGVRYKDIVVICRSLEPYRPIIETVFPKYGIPVYLDTRQPILSRLIIRFTFSVLALVTGGWNTEEFLKLLKTGLAGVSMEEVSLLENYLYVWNIRGGALLKEFTENPRGFAGEKTQEDLKLLALINAAKRQVLIPLLELKRKFEEPPEKGVSAAVHKTRALYDYLISQKIHGRLPAGNERENQEHEQTWNALMDIFDQLVFSLQDTPVDGKRYVQLLQLVCAGYDEGQIPQTLDQVTVGGADRIRTNEPAAAFLIGAAEGEFPLTSEDFGLFSLREREALSRLGAEIVLGGEEKWLEERFICYLAMTCMTDRLFISYPESELSGTENTESALMKEIKRLYPAVRTENMAELPETDLVETLASALPVYARESSKDTAQAQTVRTLLIEDSICRVKIQRMEEALQNRQFVMKNPALSRTLFGENMAVSPTRLEQFYTCKFKYFCQYGVKARPLQKAEFSPLEAGSVFHYVLEAVISRYPGGELAEVSAKELAGLVEQLLDEYLSKVMQGKENKTARFRYLFARLKNSLVKLLLQLGAEFAQSEFTPCDFELPVSFEEGIRPIVLDIASGGKIFVEGRVDRADIFVRDDQKYVRVVDYKSGAKEFKLSDVYNGLNMQMLVYLFSIWQNGAEKYQDVLPAGVLYMPVQGKIPEVDRHADDEEAAAVSRSAYKMNGLILSDTRVAAAMEKDISGVFIPAKLKKDMTFDSTSSVASLAQMGAVKERVEKLIIGLADELRAGNIEAVPTISGSFDPCAYCDYFSVCLHEDKEQCRRLPRVSRREILEQLMEEHKNG